MQKEYSLYVDESGLPDLAHYDRNFTFCGIIVRPYQAEELKIQADQIKFKYWNHTNLVFHSHDIGNKNNDFAILRNPVIERDFLANLFSFLQRGPYTCLIVSVNKNEAQKMGWTSKQILDNATDKMIESFLEFLSYGGYRGSIILESSTAKDISFYKTLNYEMQNESVWR